MVKQGMRIVGVLLLALTFVTGVVWAQPIVPGEGEPRLGAAVTALPGIPRLMYTGCGGVTNVASGNYDYEAEVVELVNAERAKIGLPPLKRVDSLDDVARYHAVDMDADAYFEHDTYDRSNGDLVYVCTWSARIGDYYTGGSKGENIAGGYRTPEQVMNGWMNSSGHRANILREGYWEIGVGFYDYYWVQDFGKRSSVYPVVINREAVETDSYLVDLYVYGDWSEMRIRNDGGAWSDWMTFRNEVTGWALPPTVGEHTVEVEMRDGGSTASYSDKILLTQGGLPTLDVPESVSFIYSMADAELLPASHYVVPVDSQTGMPLSWEVSQVGTWFTVSPQSGTTPQGFTITPADYEMGSTITYNGVVTVTVTSPDGTQNSPARINVTLYVFGGPFERVYLPLVQR